MTRANEGEKEALRQAAESARGILSKLFHDKVAIEKRIAALQAVVTAWENISGRRSKKSTGIGAVMETIEGETKLHRAKRGQVLAHIDAVLKDGKDCEEPEIRKRILDQFHVAYGRSTVYSTLRRLKGKKYGYNDEKKTWRLGES